MRIAFLGLGLIGGSIAQALRAADPRDAGEFAAAALAAWSPSGRGPTAAHAAGVLDSAAASLADAVNDADLVVISAPPLAALDLVDGLGRLGHAGLVTDVTSTKAVIVARAAAAGLRFVGGHPLAGRETAGFGAADPTLFADRRWAITTDGAEAADLEQVEALARACRARPRRMSASDHDTAVAGISHLPLALAAALVEAVAGRTASEAPPAWPLAAELAASGWRDMTRLARGDVEMGAGIATTNAAALAAGLRDARTVIDGWLADLERPGGPNTEGLTARLRQARARLEDGA